MCSSRPFILQLFSAGGWLTIHMIFELCIPYLHKRDVCFASDVLQKSSQVDAV